MEALAWRSPPYMLVRMSVDALMKPDVSLYRPNLD